MPAPTAPALRVTPLATLRLTGGFGEIRGNHLHAGVDLSTGGHVGEPVRAPLPGWFERVRTSGTGYGRSLYLHARDGRLLVFGHLDALAPPLAAWVDSVQVASGQYEQDLVPVPERFRCAAGDTIAWSGESGVGSAHLHVEIRHGDFALNPLRAGIAEPPVAPRLELLTLEPLDERSFVARGAGPRSLALRARPETLVVEGTVRAVVRARAGLPRAAGVPAWSTALEWHGRRIEARLDSISWAGEMSEEDEVVDRGRVTGSDGLILWRPPGFTPRFLPAPPGAWDGRIVVGPGAPAEPLRLVARDANGLATERTVWLRGPRAGEAGPDTARATARPRAAALRWRCAPLPDGRLRVTVADLPAGLRGVRIGGAGDDRAATPSQGAWSAVLVARPGPGGLRVHARTLAGRAWEARLDAVVWEAGVHGPTLAAGGGWTLALPPDRCYEPLAVVSRLQPGRAHGELADLGPDLVLEPLHMPLRGPATLTVALPAGERAEHVDVYRFDGSSWRPQGATWSAATRTFTSEVSGFGTFALLRDGVPPRPGRVRPYRRPGAFPYSRWELVARVRERGSGVDPRASAFTVDGVRVPSEWDPEAGELRWRPARRPAAGRHAWRLEVADRAGNVARSAGSFVLGSASR